MKIPKAIVMLNTNEKKDQVVAYTRCTVVSHLQLYSCVFTRRFHSFSSVEPVLSGT